LAKALDIAEAFAGDVEFLQLNKDLSEQGRDNQRRAKLRAAIRDLRDARTPVDEMQKKLDAKRKAVAMPAFDPKDSTGFLRRQELRSVLRSMNAEQRAMHLNDPSFADALLEQPAIVSGLFLAEDFKGTISPEIQRDRDIVAAAKEKRLAGLFGPQLEEIAELEKIARLPHLALSMPSWFSMSAGGDVFKTQIKLLIMSSCVGKQVCVSCTFANPSEKMSPPSRPSSNI
jgi:hypothetical protein